MTRTAVPQALLVGLCLLLLAVGGWAWLLYSRCDGDGRESFGDKHESSILESLEARQHESAISAIEFIQHEGYRIACVPGLKGERVWIMLNPQSPPYYKQMPHADYTLSEDQYLQIVRTQRPISTVDECLSSHVRRAP
jgi:hypothetical protein